MPPISEQKVRGRRGWLRHCGLLLFLAGLTPLHAMLEGTFLYFPSHLTPSSNLASWYVDGKLLGFSRITASPQAVWLVCHGNAGQASERSYIVNALPAADSVFVLEYPGYGVREGTPSMNAINAAALEAYRAVRELYPKLHVGVFGESMGSGPASYLCSQPDPPNRLVLVVPFDNLLSVAKESVPFLPVSLLMRDRWDNVKTLANYQGRIEIFGASEDRVIPVHHARNLSQAIPRAIYRELPCGHNEWSSSGLVKITDEKE